MNKENLKTFSSTTELDEQLSKDVADRLRAAIDTKGTAILCVSGGSTPLNFFTLLSQQALDWDKVTVTLADERWVPPEHPDSNQKLVQDHLIKNKAAAAKLLPIYNDAPRAISGEQVCHEVFSRLGQFDVVVLGMGTDGHTASLFPQATRLEEGLNMDSTRQAIGIDPITAPHERMSLTMPRLLRSDQIIVHITGDVKKELLEQAMRLDDVRELPIAAILQQDLVPTAVYWA